jgi:hypothetical protein
MKRTAIILIAFVTCFGLSAQNDPFKKEIKEKFSVNPDTRLEIINRFGNVDILNGSDPEISINVSINLNTKDQETAEEMLKMIRVNMFQENNIIRAVTEIDKDFGRNFSGFHFDNNGLQINYTVTMPATVPVNISNKYGNVFIDQLHSSSIIDVKYGKLTANKLLHDSNEPLTKVYLSYSNGTIQEVGWLELDIKYSKLSITESKALAIISKYSKLYITNASSIVSDSKYDTYEIDKLNNMVTTAAYGHFNVKDLYDKLQVETKYTDVVVNHVDIGFKKIDINNSYGSYKLSIDPAASYRLKGYSRFCNIIYPEAASRINRFNENNEINVDGIIGTNQTPEAAISINSSYGNIRLIP